MSPTESQSADRRLDPSSPLIVVSNRLPFVVKRDSKTGRLHRSHSAGGLVTALSPVVVQCNGLWIGWPGSQELEPSDAIPEPDPNDPSQQLQSDQVKPVHVSRSLFESYYNGCCNGTFWPLFHSMPDRAVFNADDWKAYRQVNEAFARRTVDALRQVDRRLKEQHSDVVPTVWIHDYQLMTAAQTIRETAMDENLRCKLGFFLHIPFPSWDIMRLFPWDNQVLEGILACDLVAFHIDDYCLNFVDCCQRRLGCRVDRLPAGWAVEFDGRSVQIRALPIGIPFQRFVCMAQTAPKVMKEQMEVVLGVDRLDYTKGLVQRIKAFERLLERHPQHLEKVIFLQIAVPSRTDVREYQQLKEELDQLIGRINGRFSRPNWSPIRYIYGCVAHQELAAFYRDSSVALVTPLRDGMNLVAKEFVACQIRRDKPGVLILSPFAGAGATMEEALIVNPYEVDQVADTIHKALDMAPEERRFRMERLRDRESRMDVDRWMSLFIHEMNHIECSLNTSVSPERMDQWQAPYLDPANVADLCEFVGESCKLALLLDYDGTLAPVASHPDLAVLPELTRQVLIRLSRTCNVAVCVMSGRSVADLKRMVAVPGITYAGNQGLEVLHPDGSHFIHPLPEDHTDKLDRLLVALQEVCLDGAWTEDKGATLTYHYRKVAENRRPYLIRRALQLFRENGFQPEHTPMAIEARPAVHWDKGRAALYILRSIYGCDWAERVRVIYAGDDESDEEALQALRGFSSCTFRVAPPSLMVPTAAHYRLADEDQLLPVLQVIERRLAQRSGLPAEENPSLADVLVTCIHSADEGEPVESKRRRRNSSSLYGAKSAFRFSVNQWAVRHESHNSADATTAVMGH